MDTGDTGDSRVVEVAIVRIVVAHTAVAVGFEQIVVVAAIAHIVVVVVLANIEGVAMVDAVHCTHGYGSASCGCILQAPQPISWDEVDDHGNNQPPVEPQLQAP